MQQVNEGWVIQLKSTKGLLLVALLSTLMCFLLVCHMSFLKPSKPVVPPLPTVSHPIQHSVSLLLPSQYLVWHPWCISSSEFKVRMRRSVATRQNLNLRPNTWSSATGCILGTRPSATEVCWYWCMQYSKPKALATWWWCQFSPLLKLTEF